MNKRKATNANLSERTPFNRDVMKLSDGNTIYVDLSLFAVQSKFIEEILKIYSESKNKDEINEIEYKGDIETYKFIYRICEDQTHEQNDYIKENITKLDGSKIVMTMDYLQMPSEWIKDIIMPYLALWKSLLWDSFIPDIYLESFIPKVIIIEPNYFAAHKVITINHAYYHIINKYDLHKRLLQYLLGRSLECDKKIDENIKSKINDSFGMFGMFGMPRH